MPDADPKATLIEALRAAAEAGQAQRADDVVPQVTAFLSEHATPDFACAMCGLPPTRPVVYPGVDGLARAWSDWAETFEDVRIRFEEVIETDDHVVVLADQRAVTRHGEVEVSQPSAMVWSFAEGEVDRIEFHLDRRAALAAAGVSQ